MPGSYPGLECRGVLDKNKAQNMSVLPVVLVLDDEQAYTKVMSMVLREYGFDPIPANSAEDAWKLLDRVTPDLVLLDVMMPNIDGITFLNELRAHVRLRVVPVLVVTAYTETREEALRAGASGYLNKPFSAQQLRESIGEFLRVTPSDDPIF